MVEGSMNVVVANKVQVCKSNYISKKIKLPVSFILATAVNPSFSVESDTLVQGCIRELGVSSTQFGFGYFYWILTTIVRNRC
ncbi:hypothetical protein MKW98_018172 [Papaver atlanticum]|uniref:Uncharacterized protein n=1 Tax=Papaver atlanticum TaxID=357466 RepID=A0AAD4SBY9_9MAGN|nr:hypothetical protein MKW98_018172 [Papaver atlanticum]